MKQKLSDMIVSYLLKGGILLDTKGEFETEIDFPIVTEDGTEKKVGIRIRCKDLTIRTIKEEKDKT